MIFDAITNPFSFLIFIFSIVTAITIHEWAHAYVADRLGDPTPRLLGRLKLNPLVHLDLFGSIFFLVSGFGWGKPVPVDLMNLQNPRKDGALISIAGPMSNIIIALFSSILLFLLQLFNLSILTSIGYFVLVTFISINLSLALFNLIPIHPLDGFSIIGGLLPDKQADEWQSLERFGFIFLALIIFPIIPGGSLINQVLRPILSFLMNLLVQFPQIM